MIGLGGPTRQYYSRTGLEKKKLMHSGGPAILISFHLSRCPRRLTQMLFPGAGHWHTFSIGACPKLDFIQIHIYFRAPGDAPQPQNIPVLSLAGAGMLSQASGTLRKVAISLWDLPRVTTVNNRRMLRLPALAFDKVLISDRFPVLEEVRVGVIPDWAYASSVGSNGGKW